jgi:hypothetical protein
LFLGNGAFAPFRELRQEQAGRPTLFLPSRLQVMGQILDIPIIPDPCNGGSGTGGFGGTGGTDTGEAGAASIPIPTSSPAPSPTPERAAAPRLSIVRPPASRPIAEMQRDDAKIREPFGQKTLSGRSARVTH